jgi:ADP-ribose pyrophosphatase YjhB (NUDIX family)
LELEANVFDIWVFRRAGAEVQYLLLHTSQLKADRHFNSGRFWQIPSGVVREGETMLAALERSLAGFGIDASAIWAAEHGYTIYNRRFGTTQIIHVFAAEARQGEVRLDPEDHSESRWCSFDEALSRVTYRGLKDGLRSTREFITGREPPRELQLR